MITLARHDITTYGLANNIDVIVNSANPFLGGIGPGLPPGVGGVDGAIHRAAGIELLEACYEFALFDGITDGEQSQIRCSHGDLRITPPFRLPYKKIFHAIAPRYVDGMQGEMTVLEAIYDRIFLTLIANNLDSIVIPALGTRSYGMPKLASAKIAIARARHFVERNQVQVHFAILENEDFDIYDSLLSSKDWRWCTSGLKSS